MNWFRENKFKILSVICGSGAAQLVVVVHHHVSSITDEILIDGIIVLVALGIIAFNAMMDTKRNIKHFLDDK